MIYFKDDPADPENRNKPYRTLGNNFFKKSLVVLLAFGIFSNLFSVFILKNGASVIGLILQVMTMASIFQKWRYQELLVKLWASLCLFAGITGAIAYLTAGTLPNSEQLAQLPKDSVKSALIIVSSFLMTIGLYFFTGYRKNCEEV
jgi:hypothetical protein